METHRDSFYVYLNSKFNREEHLNNTGTSFTNIVKPSIPHANNYEVGLVNIMFNPNFYVIGKGDESFYIHFRVTYIKSNGNLGGLSIRYIPTVNIKSNNIHELIQYLNNDIVSFLLYQQIPIINTNQIFKYSPFKPYVEYNKLVLDETIYTSCKVSMDLSDKMSEILGIKEKSFDEKPTLFQAPKFPKTTERLLIYTDIIEATYYGNLSVSLLDMIPMKNIYLKNQHFSYL